MSAEFYFGASAGLFLTGLLVVLIRRHPVLTLIGLELMWAAGVLNFLGVGRFRDDAAPVTASIPALFGIGMGAAETALGLALVLVVVKKWKSTDLTDWRTS